MALTEEQRKRMEENRKRALERKRTKQIEKEKKEKETNVFEAGGFVGKTSDEEIESKNIKKRRLNDGLEDAGSSGKKDLKGSGDAKEDGDDESSLEDFEHDASPHISQTEAQRTYCIPKGTLDVCSYIEKDNPHKRGWSKMKLYNRSEVRQRAWKRFGGKAGLIEERERRRKKRFEKDLDDMKDVFG